MLAYLIFVTDVQQMFARILIGWPGHSAAAGR
jgi:hypothetical protein